MRSLLLASVIAMMPVCAMAVDDGYLVQMKRIEHSMKTFTPAEREHTMRCKKLADNVYTTAMATERRYPQNPDIKALTTLVECMQAL